MDRSPLSLSDLGPANPIIRSLVDELLVACVHRIEGCTYTSQRQLLATHLKDECSHSQVVCMHKDCEEMLKRSELPRHIQETHQNASEEEETSPTTQKSTPDNDDKTSNECPHSIYGCPYDGPLASTDHLLTCPYETIKDFFPANTARLSLLTEQNLLMRHRMESLEGTVQSLRRDMAAVRHALGPWFRLDSPSEPPLQNQFASSSSSSARAVGHGEGFTERLEAREYASSIDPLAFYFPEASQVRRSGHRASTSVGGVNGHVGLPGPTIGHQVGFQMAGPGSEQFGHPPGLRTTAVAPLDLGTTLEGTLKGLRESVVNVAAGMDSLGRRSEIALTNESLRLGEEVVSLRGNVHGLRMQVHAMMMDRNAQFTGRGSGGDNNEDGLGWMIPPPGQRMYAGSITKL